MDFGSLHLRVRHTEWGTEEGYLSLGGSSMNEPQVFNKVVSELSESGYECLIHYPEAHSEDYGGIPRDIGRHKITIAGRYPDIIGFTPTDAIFTVEVKGSSDVMKGIGQAMTYRRGSHLSYLAASESAIESHVEHLIGHGIGGLCVTTSGQIKWYQPRGRSLPSELTDIEGRLKYRLRHKAESGHVSTIALAQPLNFFAPVIGIRDGHISTQNELESVIESGFGFSATNYAVQGARMLNLVDTETCRITAQGEMALTTLSGAGIQSFDDLASVKEEVRGSVVAEENPSIATLLRTLYLHHPDFRLLLEALSSMDGEFVLPALLEHLVNFYPNVYLNLVCRNRSRDKARKRIENGRRQELYNDHDIWVEFLHSNFISNFVQQLKHIGVLAPETAGHAGRLSDYDPQQKPWILTERFSQSRF